MEPSQPDPLPASIVLDKSKFDKPLIIPAIKIPAVLTGQCLKDYKDYLLNLPKLPNVAKDYHENNQKLLLLSPTIPLDPAQSSWPEPLAQFLKEKSYENTTYTLQLGYDNLTMTEVLEQLLPKNAVIPSGFEIIGTIAHVNLRGDQLPYKNLIGKVLLDKNERLKTVVNKKEALNNQFRVPELEVIAGDANLETEQKEGGCVFKLSIDKVYWNSKLQHERDRMLNYIKESEVLCDMFCGIGPLSIRAAKKGCEVLANDLNPMCYHYLNLNCKVNKIEKKVKTFCMDAREFLKKLAMGEKEMGIEGKFKHFDHVYMNLPADAVEFLDVFRGFLQYADKETWKVDNLPMIHVYGFELGEEMAEVKAKFAERIKKAMGSFEEAEIVEIHHIKDVSTLKRMYCVSFRLSKEVAMIGEQQQLGIEGMGMGVEAGGGNKKVIVIEDEEKKEEEKEEEKKEDEDKSHGDVILKKIRID